MYKVYDNWPEISKNAYNQDIKSTTFSDIDHIVFAGMGGSGAIGDIFSSILSKENIHVYVTKGYSLPKTVDSNTLVVVTSITGNTIETLTVLESAKKTKCKIIVFSSGGKIEEYCNKYNIEYRKIHQIHSPRASFTSFLYSMLKVLRPILPLEKNDIVESLTSLEKTNTIISSHNLNQNNISLELAKWIINIPVIYYPAGLQAASIRFKNSLQENVKMHAMTEDVIEACHNGIVSWETPSNVQPILLRGKDDHIKTKERWEILKEFYRINQIEYKEIFSMEGSILSKLINLIYVLDYATIYKAILSEIDPSPVYSIDFIKNKLK